MQFGVERVPGEKCGRPVCISFVQGAVVCWGRLKCLLNLAEAACRHSIGSVRCSPFGPGRSCGSSGGGEFTSEEFNELAVLFLFIRVVEHFAIFSGVVGSVLKESECHKDLRAERQKVGSNLRRKHNSLMAGGQKQIIEN